MTTQLAALKAKQSASPQIDDTLKQRGSRYGEFAAHAQITQDIKAVMRRHVGWARLTADQQEALEMVAHKAGRILNGDPNYSDSWHDMGGYALLVAKRLDGESV